MTEREYTDLRAKLLKVKVKLFDELNSQDKKIEQWLELSEKTFNFAHYARVWFAQGDLDTKRAIFACLGLHLILKDRKVAINLRKPFKFIFEGLPLAQRELERLEPPKNYDIAEQIKHFVQQFPILSG